MEVGGEVLIRFDAAYAPRLKDRGVKTRSQSPIHSPSRKEQKKRGGKRKKQKETPVPAIAHRGRCEEALIWSVQFRIAVLIFFLFGRTQGIRTRVGVVFCSFNKRVNIAFAMYRHKQANIITNMSGVLLERESLVGRLP